MTIHHVVIAVHGCRLSMRPGYLGSLSDPVRVEGSHFTFGPSSRRERELMGLRGPETRAILVPTAAMPSSWQGSRLVRIAGPRVPFGSRRGRSGCGALRL